MCDELFMFMQANITLLNDLKKQLSANDLKITYISGFRLISFQVYLNFSFEKREKRRPWPEIDILVTR